MRDPTAERLEAKPSILERSDMDQEARDNLADFIRSTPKPTGTRIERVRQVVERKTCMRVEGHLVDLFTASAIVTVHDGLSPENRAKFAGMPIERMASVAFKIMNKIGGGRT